MPKITNIEQQKKNKSRFSVYVDDVYAFGISEDTMMNYRKKLKVGEEIEPSFIEDVLATEEAQKAFDNAVRLLSFRSRSEKELRTRLTQKGFEENWIDKAIEKLKYYGYLSDESFARMFAKDRQNVKKLGSRGIKAELKQKGVDNEIIDEVIEEICSDEKELEQAIALCEKKYRTIGKDPLPKQKQKLLQFLVRKGYSFDIAGKAIAAVLAS